MTRRNRQAATALLLGIWCIWHISTVVHLLVTPHMVCEHGKIVAADMEKEASGSNSHNEDNSDHEDCLFLTFLTSARTLVSEDKPIEAVEDAFQNEVSIPYDAIVNLHGEEIFHLAPSNSPPTVS